MRVAFKLLHYTLFFANLMYFSVSFASPKKDLISIVVDGKRGFSKIETLKIFDHIKDYKLDLVLDINTEIFFELAYKHENLQAQSMIFERAKIRQASQKILLEYIMQRNISNELGIDFINAISQKQNNLVNLIDRNDILSQLQDSTIRNQIRYAILNRNLIFAHSLVQFLPEKEHKFFQILIGKFPNIQFSIQFRDWKKYQYIDEIIDLQIAKHLIKKREYTQLNDFLHGIDYQITFEKGQWEKLFNQLLREFFSQDNLHEVNDLMDKINTYTTSNATKASVYEVSGLFALEKGQYKDALEYFIKMKKCSYYAVSRAKANYFIAKTYKKLGQISDYKKYLIKASHYPLSYYGQKAIKKLNLSLVQALKSDKLNEYTPSLSLTLTEVGIKLFEKGKFAQGKYFAEKVLENSNISKADKIKFVKQVAKIQPDLKHYLGRYLSRMNIYDQKLSFPVVKNVEDPFMLGIIRQESQFKTGLKSSKGARGLMQIMPKTAKAICKQHKIPYNPYRLSHDEAYNIKLAKLFINDLKKMFDGNLELTAAAYNAGPSAVRRWMRDEKINIHDQHTLEKIPYHETRNYVARVIEGMNVYKAILK